MREIAEKAHAKAQRCHAAATKLEKNNHEDTKDTKGD